MNMSHSTARFSFIITHTTSFNPPRAIWSPLFYLYIHSHPQNPQNTLRSKQLKQTSHIQQFSKSREAEI